MSRPGGSGAFGNNRAHSPAPFVHSSMRVCIISIELRRPPNYRIFWQLIFSYRFDQDGIEPALTASGCARAQKEL